MAWEGVPREALGTWLFLIFPSTIALCPCRPGAGAPNSVLRGRPQLAGSIFVKVHAGFHANSSLNVLLYFMIPVRSFLIVPSVKHRVFCWVVFGCPSLGAESRGLGVCVELG